MRALAEYVMRGRVQALWVAVLVSGTVMFSWLGAAIIALVTLRKGFAEGGHILMWAVLPAAVVFYMGELGPLGMLLGATLLAVVLRLTVNWPLTLIAAVGLGLVSGILLVTIGAEYLTEIAGLFEQMFAQLQEQLSQQGKEVVLLAPTEVQIAGLLSLMNVVGSVLCLLLARWWQAELYNPGGFGVEFKALRLPPVLSIGLVGLAIALSLLGGEYRSWALISMVPLVFASFALVHGLATEKRIQSSWLFFLYMAWLLFDVVKVGLVLVALADSWIDFRARSRAK